MSFLKSYLFAVCMLLPISSFAADFNAETLEEMHVIRHKVWASHFLMRTTFGPTENEVEALAERIGQLGRREAFEEWIDSQFNDFPLAEDWKAYEADRGRLWPLTWKMLTDMGYESKNFALESEKPGGVRDRNNWKEHAWWHRALTSKDQLRQRMAWALAQIFVVAEGAGEFQDRGFDISATPRWLALPKYYDDVCIGQAFGNYRELIGTVTYSPTMGVYLNHLHNQKANPETGIFPDENFAREIMQLFSIGLVELDSNGEPKRAPDGELIETYDNQTVKTLARVFTGLVYDNNRAGTRFPSGLNMHSPMEMHSPVHDMERKVAFDGRLVIPAREETQENANQDISDVLDFFAYEHENTGPFICRQLIQRFVMSNPPNYYVRRVVKVWNENRQNPKQFEEVLKAILLDRIALSSLTFRRIRSPNSALNVIRRNPTEWTRLREPVLRYTAMLRTFSTYPNPDFIIATSSGQPYYTPGGPEGDAGKQYFFIDNEYGLRQSMAQVPFESESVFNFYRPDYQPPGPITKYATSKYVLNRKLVAPEFQIASPITSVKMMNHFRRVTTLGLHNLGPQFEVDRSEDIAITLDFSRYFKYGGMLGKGGVAPTPDQVSDFLEDLDLKLFAGTMSPKTKQVVLNAIQKEIDRGSFGDVRTKPAVVRAVISVLLSSADCAVIP